MEKFLSLKVVLFSCMLFYFIIGMSARVFVLPQEEIFPIYSWALFPTVPNTVYRYDVQILAYQGEYFNTPLLYRDAGEIVPHDDDIIVYSTIQAWGKAVERKNVAEAKKQQELFAKLHVFPGTTYQLTKLKYNPIDRWKSNTVRITPITELMRN